jgi:hypothetical protein
MRGCGKGWDCPRWSRSEESDDPVIAVIARDRKTYFENQF